MNVFTLKIRVFTRKCDIFPPKYGVSCDKIPTFSNTVCNKILTLPSLVTPSLVTLHPLFQRQRRVIRIHAEAVDHLARHRLRCFLMGTFPHRSSGLCAEPIHQHLIFRLMDSRSTAFHLPHAETGRYSRIPDSALTRFFAYCHEFQHSP